MLLFSCACTAWVLPLNICSARAYSQLRSADVEDLGEEALAVVSRMDVPASVKARQEPGYRIRRWAQFYITPRRFHWTVLPSDVRSSNYTCAFSLRDQTSALAAMGSPSKSPCYSVSPARAYCVVISFISDTHLIEVQYLSIGRP